MAAKVSTVQRVTQRARTWPGRTRGSITRPAKKTRTEATCMTSSFGSCRPSGVGVTRTLLNAPERLQRRPAATMHRRPWATEMRGGGGSDTKSLRGDGGQQAVEQVTDADRGRPVTEIGFVEPGPLHPRDAHHILPLL